MSTILRVGENTAEAARQAALAGTRATSADGYRQRAQNSLAFPTWSALAAATGMVAGDKAVVSASDAGTHNDPVTGGNPLVANAGRYTYSAAPAGWQRTGDLDSQTTAALVASVTNQQEIGFYFNGAAGLTDGIYLIGVDLPASTLSRAFARIRKGTGICSAYLIVNSKVVHGPLTISPDGTLITGLSLAVPLGARAEMYMSGANASMTEVDIRYGGIS